MFPNPGVPGVLGGTAGLGRGDLGANRYSWLWRTSTIVRLTSVLFEGIFKKLERRDLEISIFCLDVFLVSKFQES